LGCELKAFQKPVPQESKANQGQHIVQDRPPANSEGAGKEEKNQNQKETNCPSQTGELSAQGESSETEYGT